MPTSSSASSSTAGSNSSPSSSTYQNSLSPNDHLSPASAAAAGGNRTIDPFTQRQVIKSKKIRKQQGSSRFINNSIKELEPLPPIKGTKFLITTNIR